MDKLSIGCTSTCVFVLRSLATNSCLVNVLAMHLEAPHCNSVAYRHIRKYEPKKDIWHSTPTKQSIQTAVHQLCCLFIHAIIRLLFIEGENVPLASCTNRFSISINYLPWGAYIHGCMLINILVAYIAWEQIICRDSVSATSCFMFVAFLQPAQI